jgi:hypothetical protein
MARNPVRSCATHRSAPSLIADLADFLQDLAKGMLDPYRPELHYMRGPGPKWQAKYDHAPAARRSNQRQEHAYPTRTELEAVTAK